MKEDITTITELSTISTTDALELTKIFAKKKGISMNANNVKKIVYDYLKEKIFEKFPEHFELMEYPKDEIFWGRLKNESSDKIYITLIDKKISKLNKRFEEYKQDGKYYYKKSKQVLVTFGVYANASEDFFHLADYLTVDIIEFIESLFTESRDTFNFLAEKGIIINELAASDIKDFSKLNTHTQQFRKEIDIPFEYEDIKEYTPDFGKELDINIERL